VSEEQPFLVDTPERLKALADPLRQRLLTAFVQQPGTVKAVAARLGEPVTKLYRHVDQLVAAGFLRVAEEQRRRGVIERTFEATAFRFVVAPAGSAIERAEQGDAGMGSTPSCCSSRRRSETAVDRPLRSARLP
jgi:hypothetical protein